MLSSIFIVSLVLGVATATNSSEHSSNNVEATLLNTQDIELTQLLSLLTRYFTDVQRDINGLKQNRTSTETNIAALEEEFRTFSSDVRRNLTIIDDKILQLTSIMANITQKVETQQTQTTTQLSGIRTDIASARSSIQSLTSSLNWWQQNVVTDIKLGPRQFNAIHRNNGYHDAYPWIITEVSNWNKDAYPDWVGRRQLLKKVGGVWRGMPAENS